MSNHSPAYTKNLSLHHRVEWVDIVKGISIFLVVMMHSTLGVQIAMGENSWMGAIVEFARPFRIPCFMLVSGLFLHKTINGDFKRFFDNKVLHFVYFYVLWVTLQIIIKTPAWMNEGMSIAQVFQAYLTAFINPFGTLWFIYLLPVFYLVTRFLRHLDYKIVLGAAILLQILPIHVGSVLIDEFASRFVFFYIGYAFYQHFFKWAQFTADNLLIALTVFLGWFAANFYLTQNYLSSDFQEWVAPTGASLTMKLADLPVLSLALGIAGSLMIITLGSIIVRIKWMGFMRWVGEHSIIVYLAFFLPMGVSRMILIKFAGSQLSTGTIAAIVTLVAAVSPIIFYLIVKKLNIGTFLFTRPAFARLNMETPKNMPISPAGVK